MSSLQAFGGPGSAAVGDVVFVHGLDGDPVTTWRLNDKESWASWLATDRPDLNVWTLGYDLSSSAWLGHAMPLTDRAVNVLATLDASGLGRRPLCFVTHSMGGLLVKQLLRHGLDIAREYKHICTATRGVVFFGTPHSGSDLAGLVSYLKHVFRTTVAITELAAHAPALRELNLWYRNTAAARGIASRVFWESQSTKGVTVVNATSSDPGIPGTTPIPVDANHTQLPKPLSPNDVRYRQTLKFLNDRIPARSTDPVRSPHYFTVQQSLMAERLRGFVERRHITQALDGFLESHERGYFILEGAPGQGKTALASHLVSSRRYPHHFVNRTGGRADPHLILLSLIDQLSPLDTAVSTSRSLTELMKAFEDRLVQRPGRTVLVIDALDELPEEMVDVPFLPTDVLPANVYLVVTSRPGHHLERLRARLFAVPSSTCMLPPLDSIEVRSFVASRDASLSDHQLRLLTALSEGNPLYLDAALREIAETGRLNLDALPRGIEGYYRRATSAGANTGPLRDVLGLFAVARKWLTIGEVAGITDRPEREIRDQAIAAIRSFLSTADGTFGFYHERFHAFVTNELLLADELRQSHRAIARWLSAGSGFRDPYRLSSLAYHLFEADDYATMREVITKEFLVAKSRRFGYAILEDIELLTRSSLAQDDLPALENCVAMVESLESTVDPGLLEGTTRAIRFPGARISHGGLELEPSLASIRDVDLYATLVPRSGASADFVAAVRLGDRLAIIVGDAPGSGLKSAFIARLAANLLAQAIASNESTLSEAMCSLERPGLGDWLENVAVMAVVLAPAEGTLTMVNRGLPAPVLYRAMSGRADRLPVFGPTLWRDVADHGATLERHAEIGAGDIVIVATDGLVETSRMENPYGYRFMDDLPGKQGSARQIGETILAKWRAHERPLEYCDDASVVVAAVSAEGRPADAH
jgi:hypothetical protein